MRQGLFIIGAGLTGIYAYDFIAGKVNNSTGKDSLPTFWGALFGGSAAGPPMLLNYYFNEVWLLVAGLAILLFLAVS